MTNMGEVFHSCTTDATKEETQASRVQKLLASQVEEIVQLKARVKVLEHELYWNTRALDSSQIGRKHDADRIEQLEREIARKDAALGHIYAWYPISVTHPNTTLNDIRELARAALGEKKDD